MKLVVKVGGSLCISDTGPRVSYFRKMLPVLRKLGNENQLIVSIGGGPLVRNYFAALRQCGLGDDDMEWIAIDVLRVNVHFLSMLLNTKPILSLHELSSSSRGVIGGIVPGRSTDANAAHAASVIRADYFIKLTNVVGVYDKDPKHFRSAKKLPFIPFDELPRHAVKGKPGKYGILDPLAMDIIARNKIKTIVMNGKDPRKLLAVLQGKRVGTLIAER